MLTKQAFANKLKTSFANICFLLRTIRGKNWTAQVEKEGQLIRYLGRRGKKRTARAEKEGQLTCYPRKRGKNWTAQVEKEGQLTRCLRKRGKNRSDGPWRIIIFHSMNNQGFL